MVREKGSSAMRVDLETAGVPYVDEYGLVGDFHAFSGIPMALLGAKAGIPLVVMQKLMYHSDPKLTRICTFTLWLMTRPKSW